MKRITALILCLIMICSCCFAQAFADESAEAEQTEAETATIIIPEASLCLDQAAEGAEDSSLETVTLKQGDTVEVIERGDEYTKVKVNGVEYEIESCYLRFADEEEYQSWTCYTAPNAYIYNSASLSSADGEKATWVKKNTEFTVLADLGSCYYVKNDSIEGYISKDFALTGEVDYASWTDSYTVEQAEKARERQTEDQGLIYWEITIGKRFKDGTLNPDWKDPSN